MEIEELIAQLEMQAQEIADANEPGWGNTMIVAAEILQKYVGLVLLSSRKDE